MNMILFSNHLAQGDAFISIPLLYKLRGTALHLEPSTAFKYFETRQKFSKYCINIIQL